MVRTLVALNLAMARAAFGVSLPGPLAGTRQTSGFMGVGTYFRDVEPETRAVINKVASKSFLVFLTKDAPMRFALVNPTTVNGLEVTYRKVSANPSRLSKVLDNRTGLVAALLGLDECPFPESPVQLQAYLPPGGFSGVLFIENQMSFEQAIRSQTTAFSTLALVYASGFKGSAARLRTPRAASLYFSHRGELGGDRTDYFESWLFGKNITIPVSFWGDLDWSGMRILSALRNNFPDLQAWQPGYRPMLKSLLDGHGHSPEAADKKGQRPLDHTGCTFSDAQLLPALVAHGRFVDQEQFTL